MVFSTKGVHMIEPWTNQTAAVAGLLGIRAQGYQRSARDGLCLYRGPNGLKCYIGHLIPDELYDPLFENKSYEEVLRSLNIEVDINLFGALQHAHDSILKIGGKELFEHVVRRLFKSAHLEYPAP